MPRSDERLRQEKNLKEAAVQIVKRIVDGKPGVGGAAATQWTADEINRYLAELRFDDEFKLSDGGRVIEAWLNADFIQTTRSFNREPLADLNDNNNAFFNRFLARQILIEINEIFPSEAFLIATDGANIAALPDDNSPMSCYFYAKFERIKSEEDLPDTLTFQQFAKLLAHVVDVGTEPLAGATNEEKVKLKKDKQVLALIGSYETNAADGTRVKIKQDRFARLAIQLAKDPDIVALNPDAAETKQKIASAIEEIEKTAKQSIGRVLRGHVTRKEYKKLTAEKEKKERQEKEEAERKSLTGDVWPKYLTRSELQAHGYLPNQLNISGIQGKDSVSKIHHGSELYESGLVVQLFEDDGPTSPSGSFEVSRQIGVVAASGAKTGISYVRTKPFGGEVSYQSIVATSAGVVHTFADASEFENIKIIFSNIFKTKLVGVLDQSAVKADFHQCLPVYDEAAAKLAIEIDELQKKIDDDDRYVYEEDLRDDKNKMDELRRLVGQISDRKQEIVTMLSNEQVEEAFVAISDDTLSDKFFTDEEKAKIRTLKNTTINKATDVQKEEARVLAAKEYSNNLQVGYEDLIGQLNQHAYLDDQEVKEWAAKMTSADPAKAKHLLNQPIPPCRDGSSAVMRANGNTASVTCNNDVSPNNIIYLAVPNTKNAYIRVIRIPEKGSVGVFQNGRLQMVTSDKPGVIMMDEGVVWRCTESGDHEPVELSSKGKGFPKYEWENVKANVKNFNVKAVSVSGENRYMQTMCEGKVVGAKLNQKISDEVYDGAIEELRITRDEDGKIENPDDLPEVVLRTIEPNPPREDGLTAKIILRFKAVPEEKSVVTEALSKLGTKDSSAPEEQKYTTEMVLRIYDEYGDEIDDEEEIEGGDKGGYKIGGGELTKNSLKQFILGRKDASKEDGKAAAVQVAEIAKDIANKRLVVAVEDFYGQEKTEVVQIDLAGRGLFNGSPLPMPHDPIAVKLAAHATYRAAG